MTANYQKVVNDIRVVTAVSLLMSEQKIGTPRERWKYKYRAERMLARLRGCSKAK